MFKLQIFAVLLSLAVPGLSVGCEEIGLHELELTTGEWIFQLDPLVEGQGFDILDARDCLWRFHPPRKPAEEPESIYEYANQWRNNPGRISTAQWTDTENSVAMTVENFVNSQGQNSMLWLSKTSEAFQYAGLLRSSHVNPQGNLKHPFGTVNIILPSGKGNVNLVHPLISEDEDAQTKKNAEFAIEIGIVGLSGDVNPAQDYAYAPLFRLAEGLKHRFPQDAEDLAPDPSALRTGPWLKAERANGDCVVIDLRQVETYLKNTQPQKLSEVCNFVRAAKRDLESTTMPVSWAG